MVLKDIEGKEIGRGMGYKLKDLESLEEGNTLPVGVKEIEIQRVISAERYASGQCFTGACSAPEEPAPAKIIVRTKPKPFRLPTLGPPRAASKGVAVSLHDPSSPNAAVLPRPPPQQRWGGAGGTLVDVVVDPHLALRLRPHQRAGVEFLYRCVMGFHEHQGVILADEMGLGMTLQCITLLWTLLRQGPFGRPVVRRALVVTPSSLTQTWAKEINKWLGKERIRPYVVDQKDFGKQLNAAVMIISYEMLVRSAEVIGGFGFELLLCDEGHRLKNSSVKASQLLAALGVERRVLLTGTPVQNDMEFVAPGCLGSSASFKRIYEEPILQAQQPQAPAEARELAESRSRELSRLTAQFVLRRTQQNIDNYLPPKQEYVVFCRPAEAQLAMYDRVLGSPCVRACFGGHDGGDHLRAIAALRKLCNHPALLLTKDAADQDECGGLDGLGVDVRDVVSEYELGQHEFGEEHSGKLAVVSCLLWAVREAGSEKVVLVSNFTSTLDMLAALCRKYDYPFLHLDGSTSVGRRQELVNRFNSRTSKDFVFLLSARAGGVGLSLVAASRIVLYDLDWNPATDAQAASRIYRDGQARTAYIYR